MGVASFLEDPTNIAFSSSFIKGARGKEAESLFLHVHVCSSTLIPSKIKEEG